MEAYAQTNDILHSVELEDHDEAGYLTLGVMLKAVRKNRREAKDLSAVLTPVVEWVEGNRATVKALEKLLGEVRKAQRAAESRIYTPRTNILDKGGPSMTAPGRETPAAVERVAVCVMVCRRGRWVEADPCGVMCPFCGAWQHLPNDQLCPNTDCGALLEGVVYQRELRKLRRNAAEKG